jgi:hypothetical protein
MIEYDLALRHSALLPLLLLLLPLLLLLCCTVSASCCCAAARHYYILVLVVLYTAVLVMQCLAHASHRHFEQYSHSKRQLALVLGVYM